MATPVSFDITSGVDLQEVDNAVNQARKEVAQRYDFKGSRAAIELNRTDNTLVLTADDDFKMTALWEILQGRLVRRGVPTKNLTPGDIERAANDTVRRVVTLQQGIPTEAAREIVKFLKDNKLKKVQAAIQADQVRVTSPRRTTSRKPSACCANTTSASRSSSATIEVELGRIHASTEIFMLPSGLAAPMPRGSRPPSHRHDATPALHAVTPSVHAQDTAQRVNPTRKRSPTSRKK